MAQLRLHLPTDVILERFDLSHKKGDGTDLLSNASLTIGRGRRYGLIGRNGCGKSTFFDALVQRQFEGVPADCVIMSTKQHVKGDDRTPLQWLLQAAPLQSSLTNRLRVLRHELQLEEMRQQQARELAEFDKEAAAAAAAEAAAAGAAADGGDGGSGDGSGGGGSGEAAGADDAEAAAAARADAAKLADLAKQVAALEEELQALDQAQSAEEARARQILGGLGFTEKQIAHTPTSMLSGG